MIGIDLPTLIAKAQMEPGWGSGGLGTGPQMLGGQIFPGHPAAQEFEYREVGPQGTDLVAGAGMPLALMISGIKPLTNKKIHKNLIEAGIEVRDYPIGHMITPEGKGLSPMTPRGIANHWETAIDAGYLPKTQLEKLSYSPSAIVNGLLKKGWLRNRGFNTWETWGLPQNHKSWITEALDRETKMSSPKNYVYIDDSKSGLSYQFTLGDYIKNNYNIDKTLKQTKPLKYQTSEALDLDKVRKMFIKEGYFD